MAKTEEVPLSTTLTVHVPNGLVPIRGIKDVVGGRVILPNGDMVFDKEENPSFTFIA